MKLAALLASLPNDFAITLADIGSAGGIHARWLPIRDHVHGILFDPFSDSGTSERDRYYPVALGRGEGTATLNVTERESMTSTLLPNTALLARFQDKPEHVRVKQRVEVPTVALDTLVARDALRIDAIKIDVQGGEHEILMGARDCLAQHVFFAEIELSFLDRYVGLVPFGEIVTLMAGLGFDLLDINRIKRYRYRNSAGVLKAGLGKGTRPGRLAFCDAYFIRRDEALLERLAAPDDPMLPVKLIVVLLLYGKADIAAWYFDAVGDRIEPGLRDRMRRYFHAIRGVHYGAGRLHLIVDRFAKRI